MFNTCTFTIRNSENINGIAFGRMIIRLHLQTKKQKMQKNLPDDTYYKLGKNNVLCRRLR